jgi:hypothetical protein
LRLLFVHRLRLLFVELCEMSQMDVEAGGARLPSAAEPTRGDNETAAKLQMDAFKSSESDTTTAVGGGAAMTDEAEAPDAYKSRDIAAAKEEEAGALQFRVVRNDGERHNMIW